MIRFIVLFFMLLTCHFSMAVENEQLKESSDIKDYILGSGDMIRITVYGNPDMTTESRLSSVGAITFPLVGEVLLSGLSSTQAENKISDLLQNGGFLKNAQVNLVILQFQSYSISILGDVLKPGQYSLEKPSKLSDVLALAGGPSPNGSDMVSIIRTKDGKSAKYTYDLRDLLKNAEAASNPPIYHDDIVFVNAREVSILGQVGRPGKYSLTSGVRTVLDFLSQAGGINPSGAETIVVMTKIDGKLTKREIDVDLLYRNGDTSANFELAEGDSIYVPRTPVFYVYGEVQRPGAFRLERNMSVAQALIVGGGLTPRGTERRMRIKRQDGNELKTIDAKPSDMLLADDILYINESLF